MWLSAMTFTAALAGLREFNWISVGIENAEDLKRDLGGPQLRALLFAIWTW
jgi:hypothetical protein